CVDVTNPSSPVEEFFISDINSIWRDIKTWGDYAYITTEANAGLLIVDLTDLTGNTYWHVSQFTNSTTGSSISFTSAHNIYIDENGIAYIFAPRNNGSSVANSGAVFLDVNANATSPEYLGEWTGQYIHDGMARGDTMYAGCIYAGKLFVVDVSNKSNPQTLGSVSTPNTFTHNAWVSDDGNYVFTTDEQSDAYLAAYDITNISNIQEVDRIQSNPGSNSIPHNTHVDGNFLITSYYRDGTTVHDITYPNHMIQVAYYDSYTGSGNGFNGCWGTYPFLSSGNIISSYRDSYNGKGVLHIYGRAFQQACYLMGNVIDGTNGNNISSADVTILSTTTFAQTNIVGDYQTAVVDSGTFLVVFSKNGYISDTLQVSLTNGVMTILDATLYPPCFMNITVSTTDASCFGGNDGTATVQVSGGQPPYAIDWGGVNPNALSAGFYPITIYNNSCIKNDTVVISEPNAINVNAIATDVLCSGDCNGTIFININGGVQPYNISWYDNGTLISNNIIVSNLCAGNYNFILTDNNNCTENGMLSILEPTALSLSVSADTILCNGGTSIATAYPYGGVAPYFYNWSNNSSNQTTVLSVGQSIITITDTNGCSFTDSIMVYQNDSILLYNNISAISCNGANDGSIAISISSGGQIPFQYSVDNGVTFQNTNQFSSLSAGTYFVVVMDANLCLANAIITLTEPLPLTATSPITDVSCYGDCDGNIQLFVSGGMPNYNQNWNGADPNALCAGTFVCTITDSNSCVLSVSNTVIEPSQLTAQIIQNVNDLDAIANGGTLPYTFVWNTVETTPTITPTQNGTYWLIVSDNNGCTSDTVFIIFDNFPTSVLELNANEKTLKRITDILGRETSFKENNTLFYLYDDGTVEKRIVIE
ncbi:MAG TPA: choice-of-anchor B family protein, partial [Flavobacteriales bacterium]|nr:choice-of-anchor B family protein [Flavobacteriales bacterium]